MLEHIIREPKQPATACIIWLHGLGANGADMAGLAEQAELLALPIRHVFLDAPYRPVTLNAGTTMRAWYNIYGMKITDREDREGLKSSQALVMMAIQAQIDNGLRPDQIVLAGFSQGGAMALYTALHTALPLGGVIALSAYLPLSLECKAELAKSTPIFIGSGLYDPIVLPDWTQQSERWLKANHYTHISSHQYRMEHTICLDEIKDIGLWLSRNIRGV